MAIASLGRVVDSLRPHVVSADIRLSGLLVVCIAFGVAGSLLAAQSLGLAEGTRVAEIVAFGVLPALGGLACGLYGLGVLTAGGVGLAPGVVVYLYQLAAGSNGDLAAGVFAAMLTSVTLPIAHVGFGVGILAAMLT